MRKILLPVLLAITVSAQAQYRLNDFVIEMYDNQSQAYIPGDSVHYHYSGVRGGYISNEQYYYAYDYSPVSKYFTWHIGPHMEYNPLLQYDSCHLYVRQNTPNVLHTRNIQTFTGNNSTWNKFSIYYQNMPGSFNNYGSRQTTFTNGRLSSYTVTTNPNVNLKYVYRYNAQNFLDSIITTYTSHGVSSISTTKYNYSSGSIFLGRDMYSVNNSTTVPTSKEVILYTQNGLVDSLLWLYNHGNGLDTANWTVFTYNSNNDIEEQKHYVKNGYGVTGWSHIYTIKMSYNSSGRRTADTTYYDYIVNGFNTGFIRRALRTYGYDANGIVNDYEVQYWDSVNKVWGGGTDSLYGPAMRIDAKYTGNLSVGKATTAANHNMKLYPLPAQKLITIKADMPDDKPFEVLIYNMQGTLIRQWQESGTRNYTRTIPVDDIPAGTYIITLSGSEVNLTERMIITK